MMAKNDHHIIACAPTKREKLSKTGMWKQALQTDNPEKDYSPRK